MSKKKETNTKKKAPVAKKPVPKKKALQKPQAAVKSQEKLSPRKNLEPVRSWHLFSAKGKVLGRLTTDITRILQGKHKASWVPYLDKGDYVVVSDAKEVVTTGNKDKQKFYKHYSGYPGGLKLTSLEKMREVKPEEIIRHAVWGMMPKTKLARQMMKKLYIFSGSELPKEIEGKIKSQISKIKN